jgi:uncharacterized protein (DUF433 family)
MAILASMKSTVVTSSPDVMGGTPVFSGTRVPIENLLDYLEGGESIEDFLEGFPSVSREQVITFMEEPKALPTHNVKTVRQMGWTETVNPPATRASRPWRGRRARAA